MVYSVSNYGNFKFFTRQGSRTDQKVCTNQLNNFFDMLFKCLSGASDMHIKFTLKWVVKSYQEFALIILL